MQKYRFLDFTSDVMFEAYGRDLKEMFQNAAEALFSLICDIKKVEPRETVNIEVESQGIEELLCDWLSLLLTESEIKEMFFSKFEVDELKTEGFNLKGRVYGESMTPGKGETVVKGVTYYKLMIEERNNTVIGRVTLDI
ncbi:MAG: archease [Candidatus Hydrothermarchaeales archaeon]